MIGSIIENYKVVSILGEGGMGIVYKAFDLKLERFVAIKILSPHALMNPQFIARFKREAKNQAKLIHQNIVPVYGFTEDSGTIGIVMEYVEGETLENMIRRKGRLELVESLSILKQVLIGAGYAHSKGFVHRDLKPSNIIISTEGTSKIMDFGISKSLNESKGITKTGTKIGTILYMSPEQIKAMEPTNQSDIYSLGITFYEMLDGRTPFDAPTEYEIMEAHLKKNPAKLSGRIENIPSEVDSILGKALHKSKEKRYKTCEEFLFDVENLYQQVTQPMVQKRKRKTKSFETTAVQIEDKPSFKTKVRFYSFAFLFVCLFGLLFYFVYTTVSEFWESPGTPHSLFSFGSSKVINYNWKALPSPTFNSLNSIYFINDSIGYACGNQGTVIKTVNGGNSWSVLSDSSIIDLNNIKFIDYQRGFIVGEKGTILLTSDAGKNWQKNLWDTTVTFFKIYFLKDNIVGFIVGANGTILKTNDSGKTWYQVNTPTKDLLYSISFSNDYDGIAVGWNGTILNTSDQGKTWILEKHLTDKYLKDAAFANDKDGIIVGGTGEVLRSQNSGKDWEKINLNTFSGLFSVFFTDDNRGFILGNKGEIWISNDSGKNWKLTNSGVYVSLTAVSETPSKKIFVAGYNGLILSN